MKCTIFWHSVKASESLPAPLPPPNLTCFSFTMETFSPRMRGGTLALKTFSFLYLATNGNSLQLTTLHTYLCRYIARPDFDSQQLCKGKWPTGKQAGRLAHVDEASLLQWLLKIPPRRQRVLCKQALAQHREAGLGRDAMALREQHWVQTYSEIKEAAVTNTKGCTVSFLLTCLW